ncbi:ferritin-like domain-containing protein [Desulfuromonas acetexigens]|uniref:Ferritin n=1 Tax=Trichloromonas acetexigens TaxID=38815 RepID=A0A550JAS1_9BACT|nr:ferritin-like domain-containing protein [Desulfuromonas acetexigens]TRO80297.1 ferritin [Desulfuromonas acetexigens]
MGTKGRAIIGLDVEELLKLLNKAFADEWLAYYQYWVGAKVAKGPMKDAVIAELLQHATEELGHANLVADRIIQLGGTPLTTPKVWFDWSNCGYDAPDDPFVRTLLQQNIQAEQCAIGVYDRMMKLTEGKDPLTYNMALTILTQEVEHEEDLQALLEDLDLMMPAPR